MFAPYMYVENKQKNTHTHTIDNNRRRKMLVVEGGRVGCTVKRSVWRRAKRSDSFPSAGHKYITNKKYSKKKTTAVKWQMPTYIHTHIHRYP